MTLLRRAPREVYRVYGEDEFFACADRDERLQTTTSVAGGRRLRRVAGATMLLAATGAVAGLVVIASLPSVTGIRRRAGTGLLAADSFGTSHGSRGQVWREPAGAAETPSRSMRMQDADRVRVAARVGAPERAARPRRAIVPAETAAAAVARQGAPVESAASPPQPLRMTASAAAVPQRSGQSEFGFER